MIAQRFTQANKEFHRPPSMTEEQCHSLWVFQGVDSEGTPLFISAWKPTPEELVKINLGEPIFLTIIGEVLPPALVSVKNPWEEAEKSGG